MGWVLDGIFTHGAPLAVHEMLIVREWGERGYWLVEMGLDNNVYERLYEKWGQQFRFEKLYLFEWRNPDDSDYNSVIRPKSLILWKPWLPSLQPYTPGPYNENKYKGPVLGVAFDKTAQNKVAIDVLKGRGYEHVGYGGDFGL
jgi:hypothetical protein